MCAQLAVSVVRAGRPDKRTPSALLFLKTFEDASQTGISRSAHSMRRRRLRQGFIFNIIIVHIFSPEIEL